MTGFGVKAIPLTLHVSMNFHDMIKFGTTGWRGIIARDFTFDNVRLATQGIADYLNSIYP